MEQAGIVSEAIAALSEVVNEEGLITNPQDRFDLFVAIGTLVDYETFE